MLVLFVCFVFFLFYVVRHDTAVVVNVCTGVLLFKRFASQLPYRTMIHVTEQKTERKKTHNYIPYSKSKTHPVQIMAMAFGNTFLLLVSPRSHLIVMLMCPGARLFRWPASSLSRYIVCFGKIQSGKTIITNKKSKTFARNVLPKTRPRSGRMGQMKHTRSHILTVNPFFLWSLSSLY